MVEGDGWFVVNLAGARAEAVPPFGHAAALVGARGHRRRIGPRRAIAAPGRPRRARG
jgi:hypothetical protein